MAVTAEGLAGRRVARDGALDALHVRLVRAGRHEVHALAALALRDHHLAARHAPLVQRVAQQRHLLVAQPAEEQARAQRAG